MTEKFGGDIISTRITGYETEPKTLEIAFMGYNPKLTSDLFKWFCENNKEEIEVYRYGSWNSFAIFKDGTKVITINSASNIRGERFDQLILCDDERWEIYGKRYDDISHLRFNCMPITNVPDEFQILEYLYDKGINE